MTHRDLPASAIVAAVLASWIMGTAAQMSGALSGGDVSPGLFVALLLFHQQVSIPVLLWATAPLIVVTRLLGRKLSTLPTVAITFGVTAVTFAVSATLYVVASLPGPLDGGNWAATLPRDITSLVAFHFAPWLVVVGGICSARQFSTSQR